MAFALMPAAAPFRWDDPATWPWVVWAWIAMLLFGSAKPFWRWLQRQRASGWPTVTGRIESVAVRPKKQFFISTSPRGRAPAFMAELAYSYALTRWQDHGGLPSAQGGYGPMHLTSSDAVEPSGRGGLSQHYRACGIRPELAGRYLLLRPSVERTNPHPPGLRLRTSDQAARSSAHGAVAVRLSVRRPGDRT